MPYATRTLVITKFQFGRFCSIAWLATKDDVLTNTVIPPGLAWVLLNHFREFDFWEHLDSNYIAWLGYGLSQFSKNISVDGLRAKTRPETGRIIAGFAGFSSFFPGLLCKISIENVFFRGSHVWSRKCALYPYCVVVGHDGDRKSAALCTTPNMNLMHFEEGWFIGYVDNENLFGVPKWLW